jgi:hypothetical protein
MSLSLTTIGHRSRFVILVFQDSGLEQDAGRREEQGLRKLEQLVFGRHEPPNLDETNDVSAQTAAASQFILGPPSGDAFVFEAK